MSKKHTVSTKPHDRLQSTSSKVVGVKRSAATSSGGTLYQLSPKWSFRFWDYDHPKWGLSSQSESALSGLITYLRAKESQTWGEICVTLGKRNPESHFIPINKLSTKVQNRLKDLHFNENGILQDEELFSLHITSKIRIWGALDSDTGTFTIIWYDPEHEVYPVEKSHT
jgi:hypothetical protein